MPEDAQKITPDKLREVGLWEEFCDIRSQHLASGMSGKEAGIKAREEIHPFLNTTSLDSSSTVCKKPSGKKKRRGATCSKDEFDSDFLSRKAGIVEVIMWVAKNLETPEDMLTPSDAPSPEAWGMLKSYSKSQERRNNFWDKIYMRLVPSKAQIESLKTTGEKDGANITRTIDRILKLNRKIEPQRPIFSSKKPKVEIKKHRVRNPNLPGATKWDVKRRWNDTAVDIAREKHIDERRQESRDEEWLNSPTTT